jgi:hypothetical protein
VKFALSWVLVILLAGCGGGEGDGFVAQLDGLCKRTNPKLVAINASIIRARDQARAGGVRPAETFATFETQLSRASVITDRLVAELRELSPPPDEEDFHADLVGSLGQGASNVKRQVKAASQQDAAALRELSLEGSRLNARTKGLVEGHGGFRYCGRG